MTNPQGTQWESEIRNAMLSAGVKADRFPKRGQADEPDLWIGGPAFDGIPILAWKRLVGKKGNGPRQPDGERRVVVIEFDDFRRIVRTLSELKGEDPVFLVQAKWTTNLNVTKTLGNLRRWCRERLMQQYDC